jgi:hypothetical protein
VSDIMTDSLSRDVVAGTVGKRVMFFTLFPRWSKQTVNLPGEGGRGQSSQGSEERGEGWEPEGAVTRASLIDRQERGGASSTH